MIQLFRRALNNIFTKILLGLLIAAFAVWGVGPNILNSYSANVASVGSTKITAAELDRAVRQRVQLFQQQGLTMDTQTLVTNFNLDYRVLDELITEAALVEHARTLELGASTDTVAEEIANIDGLTGPLGGINEALLRDQLNRLGISLNEFEKDIRDGVARQQLVNTLLSAAPLPRFVAAELFRIEQERRTATLINFPAADQSSIDAPTDEEVAEFYETQKDRFKTPERRTYNYIVVTPSRFYGDVEVTDEQVAQEFEFRKGDYISLETREIIEVTVEPDAVAAITDALSAGTDFREAVAANTSFTVEELEARTLTEAEMASDIDADAASAAFALESPGLAPVTDGLTGKRLIYVSSINAGENKTLEDVRDEVVAAIREREAINLMYDFTTRLEDAVADLGTLELVTQELEIPLASTTKVDRRGVNAEGNVVLRDELDRAVNTDAFGREVGEELRIQSVNPQDPDAGSFVVEVREVFEPEVRPLEDIKDELVSQMMQERRLAAAGETANKGLDQLRAGRKPQAIIEELGGTSFDARNVVRTAREDSESSLAPNIRRLIFDLKEGEAAVEQSGDGYIVVRVDDVRPGEPQLSPGRVDQRYATLKDSYLNDISAQYQAYLRERFPATINNELVDRLFRNPLQQ